MKCLVDVNFLLLCQLIVLVKKRVENQPISTTCSKCNGRGIIEKAFTSSLATTTSVKNYSSTASKEAGESIEQGISIVSEIQKAEIEYGLPLSKQTYPQRIHALQTEALRLHSQSSTTTRQQELQIQDKSIMEVLEHFDTSKELIMKFVDEVEKKWGIIGMEDFTLFNRIQVIEKTALKYREKLNQFV